MSIKSSDLRLAASSVFHRLKSGRLDLVFSVIFLIIEKALNYRFKIKKSRRSGMKIDVVIPTTAKDIDVLAAVISSLHNIEEEINKVFIISASDRRIKPLLSDTVVFVPEDDVLGYGKSLIDYSVGGCDRRGWIIQQLLKMGASEFVEKDNYLVLDSDTVLVGKNAFIDGNKFLFQRSGEWHAEYFRTFQKLFGYPAKSRLSYVCHMMLFNKNRLLEIKREIEGRHGLSWDKAILSFVSQNDLSYFSEYETYANWTAIHYPDEMESLPFYNISLGREKFYKLAELEKRYGKDYKSVSFHSYLEQKL